MMLSLLMLHCKEDDGELKESEQKDTMDTVDLTVIRYVGGWWSNPPTSNIYENYGVSAKITRRVNGVDWSGEFFFTDQFQSCCNSGENDGTISFKVENDSIKSFVYNDIIPNCNGTFRGEGTISTNGQLTIHFTGSDCEGEHQGGRLELSR
ncbi:MAG: hypothetical protein KI790_14460 [Cyclobacteriaceae bacterium]|nr:hypothetical protein [Cyclobacteriaceae bacterium HetDA_MAG_MS6]